MLDRLLYFATLSVIFRYVDSTLCGRPFIQPHEVKIVGGRVAKQGSLPWMAMLMEVGEQACGGSIIADNLILTAAHCFEDPGSLNPTRWEVRVGAYHVNSRTTYESVHHVQKIVMHESYNTVTVENDVAVMVLSQRINFNNMVKPICLPPNSIHVTVGQRCLSAGWGDTQGTGSNNVLNQVFVPVQDDNTCLRSDWYGQEFLPATSFCAGYEHGQRDSCLGDSGGPLIFKSNGTWYQLGITSWGYDCAQPKKPGVYTDVTEYKSWIQHQATLNGAHIITSDGPDLTCQQMTTMRTLIVFGLLTLAFAKPGGRKPQGQAVSLQNINTSGCGTQTYLPSSTYIVGGSEATPNSWPWMALLEYNGYHVCGGTLISDRHVLTAAHCVEGTMGVASKWTVRLGVHDKTGTGSTEQSSSLRSITSHRRYSSANINNDIAIMELSSPVTLNDYVTPVCITETDVAAGTNCVSTGWGDTQGTGSSDVLRQVTVPIISQQTCSSSQYYGSYLDTKTMICAGFPQGGKDSCQGDSGGPLVCPTSGNTWALTGVTSWGFGCAEAYSPGVYTRVYNYISWISNNM
ncbi:transmembrane protease serine 9-like [Pecten maximus]|uniref:transmembrane protease serine 9-like n=1 Tax=Pecten maximus TaxID=6579 RepID=UPI001458C6AE|nr:transmembrane protease serine 9-like [Pecten maximus]